MLSLSEFFKQTLPIQVMFLLYRQTANHSSKIRIQNPNLCSAFPDFQRILSPCPTNPSAPFALSRTETTPKTLSAQNSLCFFLYFSINPPRNRTFSRVQSCLSLAFLSFSSAFLFFFLIRETVNSKNTQISSIHRTVGECGRHKSE